MQALRFFLTRHPFMSAAFALAVVVGVWAGGNAIRQAIYFNDPAHRNQALEGWMTPGYVGMSWRLPREDIRRVMELEDAPRSGGPPRASQIAARLGITLKELEARVAAAAAERHGTGQ